MSTQKIMIIDDDPDFVEVTKVLFETRQYEVSAAHDPEEGFAKLEQEVPDALILDVMMGTGADGFIVARKIRKDPRFDKRKTQPHGPSGRMFSDRVPDGPPTEINCCPQGYNLTI